MYGIAASIGVACVLFLIAGGHYAGDAVPEWVGQVAWLALMTIGAAVCGFLKPVRAWRWGAVIIAVQPLCIFLLAAAVGELARPSRSTGGMVMVIISTVVSAFVSPFPILASHTAGYVRSRWLAASPGKSGSAK